MPHLALTTLLCRDYDEAIDFYVNRLSFDLLEDTDLGNGKRWVRVAPKGSQSSALLLARATTDAQIAVIGNQAGGRVFLFIHTDDFDRDYAALIARGVTIARQPSREPYGTVAVFEDLYGNRIDLIAPRPC